MIVWGVESGAGVDKGLYARHQPYNYCPSKKNTDGKNEARQLGKQTQTHSNKPSW